MEPYEPVLEIDHLLRSYTSTRDRLLVDIERAWQMTQELVRHYEAAASEDPRYKAGLKAFEKEAAIMLRVLRVATQ